MALIGRILGMSGAARQIGAAVGGVAEVFVGNRAERDAAEHAAFAATVAQAGQEFATTRDGWFDGFVNGLNRLPRPMLAIGTLGLFAYAMVEPAGFSVRMQGLAYVPEPLWWLLGAIVSFYFGARELHYRRGGLPAASFMATSDLSAARTETAGAAAPLGFAGFLPASGGCATAGPEAAAPVTPAPAAPALVAPAPAGATPAAAATPIVVRASDPHFTAAIEEWRRTRG